MRNPLISTLCLIFLTSSLGACATFDKLKADKAAKQTGRIKAGKRLPPMSADLVEETVDPGVNPDPEVAVAENRLAFRVCKGKHKRSVDFYQSMRRQLRVL